MSSSGRCKIYKAVGFIARFLRRKAFQPCFLAETVSGQSKETALVIHLAFLAKVANLYYILLTAFKKYWPKTVAKFISGTQDTFI